MEQETKKRIRRSKEEIVKDAIAKLEADIVTYEEKIAKAKKEIEDLRTPPKPAVKLKDISEKIKELDLPLDEVMKAVEKMGKK